MGIKERIAQQEADATKLKEKLSSAVKALEVSPDEEVLLAEVEELTEQVQTMTKSLDGLKRAQAAIGKEAPAVIGSRKDPKKAGDILVKLATCHFLAHAERKTLQQVMEERYKEVAYVKAVYDHIIKIASDPTYKTAVPPANTMTAGWAAELANHDVQGYVEALAPISVAAALALQSFMVNFEGFQTVSVPKRLPPSGTLTEPAWVAEGAPIPLTRFTFGSSVIQRYKLAAISTFTKEIAERSTPAIEAILREAMMQSHSEVLDNALLSSVNAVVNVRPAGLRSTDWGSETRAGASGGGEDAVRADIMTMLGAMTAHRLGAKPVLLINNLDALAVSMISSAMSQPVFAAEMANGKLLGVPFVASASVPQHLAVMVDAAYFAAGFDLPSFEVSDVATVVEASADATPPTHASDAAGAAGTAGQVGVGGGIPVAGGAAGAANAGYHARSLWQTYSIGLRMVAPTSWSVMQAGAVQSCTATTWTA